MTFKTFLLSERGDSIFQPPVDDQPWKFVTADLGIIRQNEFPPNGPKTATSKYAVSTKKMRRKFSHKK